MSLNAKQFHSEEHLVVKRLSYSQIADSIRRLYQFIEIYSTSLFAFSKMKFSVVNFSCDNSVAAVPNNWLIDSGSCYWPSYSKFRIPKAARHPEAPSST